MKQTAIIMGMPITIQVVEAPQAAAAIHEAFGWFKQVDERYSTYKPTSEIARFNSGEIARDNLSDETKVVLELCDDMRDRTNGYFDVRRPDGTLDPSGLVKGWAIAQAAQLLDAHGVTNYCLNVGGDLFVSGHNDEHSPWTIGIASPHEKNVIIKRLQLVRGAVATSGEYRRGGHIYNPHARHKTLNDFASVTVLGPDMMLSDVYATAMFAMGSAGLDWIARQPGYEAYVVMNERSAASTPGLLAFAI